MTISSTDLAGILGTEARPDVVVQLPQSGREVSIRVQLRRETRHADPVPRAASCWAPNKPSIDFQGRPTFPEFVLVRLLEDAGWGARWIKNWAGGREFCADSDRAAELPLVAAEMFSAIHESAAELRGSGSWDVFAWRADEFLFIESKQHRSSDRLNDNQRIWLEAALHIGISAKSFAIIEYDAGPPTAEIRRGIETRKDPPELPGALVRAIDAAFSADPSSRIEYRDAIARFGATALDPMVQWLADDRLRRFAIATLGMIARAEPRALRHLKSYAAAAGPDSDFAQSVVRQATPGIARVPTRPSPTGSSDVYMATGRPPIAQGPCGVVNRDGSSCNNPGRHAVGNQWSCTTHLKALTRRGQAS